MADTNQTPTIQEQVHGAGLGIIVGGVTAFFLLWFVADVLALFRTANSTFIMAMLAGAIIGSILGWKYSRMTNVIELFLGTK